MGRLFWKFFVAFWLTLASLVTVVWLYHRANDAALNPRSELQQPEPHHLRAAVAVLRHGGPEALHDFLQDHEGPPLWVITPKGVELLGRPLPKDNGPLSAPLRREVVRMPQGDFQLILSSPGNLPRELSPLPPGERPPLIGPERGPEGSPNGPPEGGPTGRPDGRPSPWEPVIFGLVVSLVLSALLAWYVAKPVRLLKSAIADVASGRLDTRVAPRIRRRDELADLGRDFDRMTERLGQLLAAQRRLLHDVSHELRSPLARLQVAIGIARQDPSKMALTLDRLERESARLDTLVGEILTLSRLESGTSQQALVTDDLADLIAEVASDADFEAKARGLAVTFSGPLACPLACHPDLLQRAIENLVRNSLKFTAPGTTVEIVLAVAGAQAVITVADRGPGVPEEELEHIFQPFIRGRNQSRDGEEAGFGLGLAIARHAVEAHGGTLAARNREGGGLLMEIKLPLGPQVA